MKSQVCSLALDNTTVCSIYTMYIYLVQSHGIAAFKGSGSEMTSNFAYSNDYINWIISSFLESNNHSWAHVKCVEIDTLHAQCLEGNHPSSTFNISYVSCTQRQKVIFFCTSISYPDRLPWHEHRLQEWNGALPGDILSIKDDRHSYNLRRIVNRLSTRFDTLGTGQLFNITLWFYNCSVIESSTICIIRASTPSTVDNNTTEPCWIISVATITLFSGTVISWWY